MYAFLGNKPQSDDDMMQAGYGLGYGNVCSQGQWLHPIVDNNAPLDASNVTDNLSSASDNSAPLSANVVPARRGRGRPRLNTPRDESAVEKRRAQVREAQRAYQKRKDSASESERRRCDDVLQVLSDLSMHIEALLQAAADGGVMKENGEVPEHIRRLWATYNTAINHPCLGPELRLLQVKNDRRQAAYRNGTQQSPDTELHQRMHSRDTMDLDLAQVNDTALISSFSAPPLGCIMPGDRNMYQVVGEPVEFHHGSS